MGFEMKITGSDGKRYDSMADMIEAEGKQMMDDHTAAVEGVIERERCPVHGESATVTRERRSDGIGFKIEGCCDQLVEQAQAAASRVR